MFLTPIARQHDGKRPFSNKSAAKLAIRRMRGRSGKLQAYRCDICLMFHIGHAR